MIYFIKAGEVNRVKIGFTRENVSERLSAIRGSSPVKLEVLGYFQGSTYKERKLHEKFKEYRYQGEWFRIEGILAEYIKDELPRLQSEYEEKIRQKNGVDQGEIGSGGPKSRCKYCGEMVEEYKCSMCGEIIDACWECHKEVAHGELTLPSHEDKWGVSGRPEDTDPAFENVVREYEG